MEYKLTCNKTSRLVEQLVKFLQTKTLKCCCNTSYTKHLKRPRNLFQVFENGPAMTAKKAVDTLIRAANALQIDLTKSGIKCSRGFDVFLPASEDKRSEGEKIRDFFANKEN